MLPGLSMKVYLITINALFSLAIIRRFDFNIRPAYVKSLALFNQLHSGKSIAGDASSPGQIR